MTERRGACPPVEPPGLRRGREHGGPFLTGAVLGDLLACGHGCLTSQWLAWVECRHMTSHYAKVHDTTIREAFDRYQSQRVNISGQRIGYDPDAPTASAEWVKHNLNRVRDSLPNGYCARPAQQDCPHPNACLTCTFIGQFDEAVAHREWARPFEATADGVSDWVVTLDTLAMYCHTYLGHFSEARQLADALASAQVSDPLTEVLCPGVISQAAFIEGALEEAGALAASTLTAARRLHFDRHYFAFHALRTTALLALERHDLAAAAEPVERALEIVSGARPAFNYLAQLDRARIWAAGGNHDAALASLPAARSALKNDHSVLRAEADELEARLRLAVGDQSGAASVIERLPGDRRIVMSAIGALAAGNPGQAAQALRGAPAEGATIRSDLELRLLRASVAISQSSPQAPALVRQALGVAERHGFIQTVVDTAPQLVEHVISDSYLYPRTKQLAALITVGLKARKRAAPAPRQGKLLEPLTTAEIRVLEKLTERLTYTEIASELYLSLNTVKTHLRHAYMKLGVTSRSSAVKRATSLEFCDLVV